MFLFPVNSKADTIYKVYVDGTLLSFSSSPIKEDGRILVPVRTIFEALHTEVTWDSETQSIHSIKGDAKVDLSIDSNTAFINGRSVSLEVPPKIINNVTYVPLRFVGEAWDMNVEWSSYGNYQANINFTYIPTILIHGFNGNSTSMDYLFNYLQPDSKYRSTITDDDYNQLNEMSPKGRPIIKVVFSDSRQAVSQQEAKLTDIIQKVQRKFQTPKVNLVGHSMGGLMSTDYVVSQTLIWKNLYPTVNKVVTIASPINGVKYGASKFAKLSYVSEDMITDTPRILQDNVKNFGFPDYIPFLSISANSDAFVPESSALYVKNFTSNIETAT
ncbi:hypothetical protein GCM10010912_69250 [Paenibacillus albidus]|uniref:Copper amine oxidase-like N-terminal domain-containing protein n=1 Tax=Paenibacillus albidus TaxID=2041023 RepID=A0A917FZ72_9BACL|nr:stalk domain-containing protein [Paenibacillus albidus]GGG14977.1 hypothetical protein GCM10010912_69250 [Paenibacillus albidus]